MLEIFIPLVLVLTGFSISKIQFFFESPPRELTPAVYGDSIERILVTQNVVNPGSDAILQERDQDILAEWQQAEVVNERRELGSIFDFDKDADIVDEDEEEPEVVEEELPEEVDPETTDVPAEDDKEEEPEEEEEEKGGSIFDFDIDDESPDENDGTEGISDNTGDTEEDEASDGAEQEVKEKPTEEEVEEKSIWADRNQSTSVFSLDEKERYTFNMNSAIGDEHLTSEQFVAGLPQSRSAFKAKYLEYSTREDDKGYQGRDTWMQMEKDVYAA